MAWASKKQYAIMMSSEEGKDLIEKLPSMSQNEFQTEFGKFIGKNGISYSEKEEKVKKPSVKLGDIYDALNEVGEDVSEGGEFFESEDVSEYDLFNALDKFRNLTSNQKEEIVEAYIDDELDEAKLKEILENE